MFQLKLWCFGNKVPIKAIYFLKKQLPQPQRKKETENEVESEAIKELRSSTQVIKREVEQSELRLHDAQQKLRDLTMNMRWVRLI